MNVWSDLNEIRGHEERQTKMSLNNCVCVFISQVIEALPGDAVSQMVPDIVPGLLKVCLSHMHACVLTHLTTYRDALHQGQP